MFGIAQKNADDNIMNEWIIESDKQSNMMLSDSLSHLTIFQRMFLIWGNQYGMRESVSYSQGLLLNFEVKDKRFTVCFIPHIHMLLR